MNAIRRSFLIKNVFFPFKWRISFLILCSAASVSIISFEPYLLGGLVDKIKSNHLTSGEIWRQFHLIVAIWITSILIDYTGDIIASKTAPLIRLRVVYCLYEWLEKHSPSYFSNHLPGSLGSKLKQSGEATMTVIDILSNSFIRLMVSIAFAGAFISNVSKEIIWITIPLIIGFASLSYFYAKKSVENAKKYGESISTSNGVIVDLCSNIELIVSNNQQESERKNLHRSLEDERHASIENRKHIINTSFITFIYLLIFQVLIIALVISNHLDGRASAGDVVMSISLAFFVAKNLQNFSGQLQGLLEQLGVLDFCLSSLLQPHEITEFKDAKKLNIQSGKIEFRNINYCYPNGQIIFKDFNLVIEGGEKIGIVGPSGAGKSTLIKLLCRYHDADSGEILVDGQNILEVSLESLRAAISNVPHDPLFFNRTLEENIKYSNPTVSEKLYLRVLSETGCSKIVETREAGFNYTIGAQGNALSSGERQRIAVARAIVKESSILFLDEFTSNLDTGNETVILKNLEKAFEKKTVIFVAHRLSTLKNLDRIIVLDSGKIREEGSHESLIGKGGYYSKSWQQFINS
jgi:ATP-binding cassette subfamily B protein